VRKCAKRSITLPPSGVSPGCSVCVDANRYHDADTGACLACPDTSKPIIIALLVVAIVSAFVGLLWCLLVRPPKQLLRLSRALRSLVDASRVLGLGAKLRVTVSFFQCVSDVGKVYMVELPREYYDWLEPFSWLRIDWLRALLPSECVGSFELRMLVVAAVPLTLLGLIVTGQLAASSLSRPCTRLSSFLRSHGRSEQPSTPRVRLSTLNRYGSGSRLAKITDTGGAVANHLTAIVYPCLLIVFLFAPGTSRAIFRA
jgi:hypothetical protein